MSFKYCSFYKLLLKKEIKDRIMIKIEDLEKQSKWIDFDITIDKEELVLTGLNLEDIVTEMNIWENIARLGVDLWRNFGYYKQFIFEVKYDCQNYRDRLISLGYMCHEGIWKCINKPKEDIVQLSVFMFCLYRLMANEILTKSLIDKSLICESCDSVMDQGCDRCLKCDQILEHINNEKILFKIRGEDIDNNANGDQLITYQNANDDIFLHTIEDVTCTVDDKKTEIIKEINKDLWQCNFIDCRRWTDNKFEYCTECGLWRYSFDSHKEGDKLRRCKNGEESEVWICSSCRRFNRVESLCCEGSLCSTKRYDEKHNDLFNMLSDDNRDCDDHSTKLSKDSKSLKTGQARQRDYNEECNQKEIKTTRKCVTCGDIDHINDVLLGEDSWICTQCVKNDRNDWTNIFNMDTQNLNKDHMICERCGRDTNSMDKCCQYCRDQPDNGDQRKWKCKLCGTMFPYTVTVCLSCNCSMVDDGLWVCMGCTYWNKFVDSRCEVCFTMNDYLVVKLCQLCKKKKINLNELFCERCEENNNSKLNKDWWQCGFKSCGIWSEDDKEYCQECGLGRHSFIDYKQGKALERLKNGKLTAVWICEQCPRFNDINSVKCNGWFCRKSRYVKRHCDDCRYYNDGSSVACMRCSK